MTPPRACVEAVEMQALRAAFRSADEQVYQHFRRIARIFPEVR